MSHIKSPAEITRLLNSIDADNNLLGYQSFLGRTHWLTGNTPEDLKLMACKQLQLNPHHIIVNEPRNLDPESVWASQYNLESEKVDMVEAAYRYIQKIGEKFPPIIVWYFFDNQRMQYILHDGHHRAYFAHRHHFKIKSVILEPLGNYHLVEEKFNHVNQINMRVIDLPIV